jgi:hypothetical protein
MIAFILLLTVVRASLGGQMAFRGSKMFMENQKGLILSTILKEAEDL